MLEINILYLISLYLIVDNDVVFYCTVNIMYNYALYIVSTCTCITCYVILCMMTPDLI